MARKQPAAKKKAATRKSQHGGRRKGAGRPRKPRFTSIFAKVGGPPDDPLRATEWGMALLTVALDTVRLDETLSPKEQRTEMKSLIRHMKDLVPVARISQAERIIVEDHKRRNAPAAPVTGSEELSDASPVDPPPLAASRGARFR